MFEAEHAPLASPVVIKLLRESFRDRPDALERTRASARLLTRLDHPNLAKVVDFSTSAAGRGYWVLEHLVGRDLGAVLEERGHVPVATAIDWVRQALAGLEHAHAAGLVHGELEVEHLFVVDHPDGRQTIKLVHVAAVEPQQAAGAAFDARVDLRALGLVLYRAVAGRDASDSERTSAASGSVGQPMPPALEALLARLLSGDAPAPFATARELSTELGRISWQFAAPGAPVITQVETTVGTPAVEQTLRSAAELPLGTKAAPNVPVVEAPRYITAPRPAVADRERPPPRRDPIVATAASPAAASARKRVIALGATNSLWGAAALGAAAHAATNPRGASESVRVTSALERVIQEQALWTAMVHVPVLALTGWLLWRTLSERKAPVLAVTLATASNAFLALAMVSIVVDWGFLLPLARSFERLSGRGDGDLLGSLLAGGRIVLWVGEVVWRLAQAALLRAWARRLVSA